MRAVRISVLGAMAATLDGADVPLGGPKQRAVLASLVLARQRTVSASRIVDEVWDGEAAPSPTTLQVYVAGLRRALEPDRAPRTPPRVLVTEGAGYALRLDPEAIDAERFVRQATEGGQALRRGDAAGAARLLNEALTLWRGAAYADFADAAFVAPEVVRLTNLRDAARQDLFAAQLALGQHTSLVGELEAYLGGQPLSERVWELLALALYRCGRQTDALAALRRASAMLTEEFGLDPGPGLRNLETAILRQEPGLDWADPATTVTVTSNIPHAISDFVGRAELIDTTRTLLTHERLITLTGTGGIGKTRLALEVARRFRPDDDATGPDGPWLVELAGLAQPELLTATVAATLGVPGVATAEHLAAVLGGRDLLLVLDNCEHLLDAARELCATLLARCARLRVLTTSRESLGITGEMIFEVPPLRIDDESVDLFLRRAASVVPRWRPTRAELATITEICAELDGVPLAIELAAAQCRVLSVGQIAGALDDRFALTIEGGSSTPARHRGLADAIAWSYRLLEPDQRALFNRLSVFAGGFDLDAVAAVAGPGGGPARMISPVAALVRKSLLTVEPETAPRRYRMLSTVRRFAADALAAEETAAVQARHRGWVIGWAEAAEHQLRGPDARATITRLTLDQAEIRAAIASAIFAGDGDTALRLGGALQWFWYRMGHLAEGLGWLRAALELAPNAAPLLRARALLGVGGLSYLSGDPGSALAAVVEAADCAHRAKDLVTEAHARLYQGHFSTFVNGPVEGLRHARVGLEMIERTGVPWLEAEALMVRGMLFRVIGDTPAARADLDRAITIAEGCGHSWAAGSSTWTAMKSAMDQGDPHAALGLVRRMLGPLEHDGDVTSWLVLTHSTAAALAQVGQARVGAVLLGAVAWHGRRLGFSPALMDPIDGPREASTVREALDAEEFAHGCAEGERLTRAQVNELVSQTIGACPTRR